ncbi:hypothetical protein HZ326_6595 [Fusarium oxysporum f. sp. albedinis]|nr:hypothetical protein HZ326_6595 [Fusarium oxysporum f. sp. albedinis]
MIVFALPHENGGITWQIASKINTMSSAPLSRWGAISKSPLVLAPTSPMKISSDKLLRKLVSPHQRPKRSSRTGRASKRGRKSPLFSKL